MKQGKEKKIEIMIKDKVSLTNYHIKFDIQEEGITENVGAWVVNFLENKTGFFIDCLSAVEELSKISKLDSVLTVLSEIRKSMIAGDTLTEQQLLSFGWIMRELFSVHKASTKDSGSLKRKLDTLFEEVNEMDISADEKKALFRQKANYLRDEMKRASTKYELGLDSEKDDLEKKGFIKSNLSDFS